MSHSFLLRRFGGPAFGILQLALIIFLSGCIVPATKYEATYTVQLNDHGDGGKKQAQQLVSIITNRIECSIQYSGPMLSGNEQSFSIGLVSQAAPPHNFPSIHITGQGDSSYIVLVIKSGPEKTAAMVNARKVVEGALNSFAQTKWKVHITRRESMWR